MYTGKISWSLSVCGDWFQDSAHTEIRAYSSPAVGLVDLHTRSASFQTPGFASHQYYIFILCLVGKNPGISGPVQFKAHVEWFVVYGQLYHKQRL